MTRQSSRSGSSSALQKLPDGASPDTRKAAVLAAVRTTGLMPYRAARSIGVAASTYYYWLDNDPDFADGVEEAESVFERRLAAVMLRSASQGSWASALAIAERRFPERWSVRARLDLNVSGPSEEDRLERRYPSDEALDQAIAENRRDVVRNMSDEDLAGLLDERKGRPA